MSAFSRAALVGYSVRCLRSWDLRRIICWARPRWKSRTSSKRGALQGSSLRAQREAGLVATCSSIRADPRLRPGRIGTGAEALRPACPIPRGREKRATENASTFRAPRTRPRSGVGRPGNRKEEEGRLKGRRPIPPWSCSLRSHPLDAPAMRIERVPSEGYAHTTQRLDKWSYAHRSRNLAPRTRTCNPHVLVKGRPPRRAESRVARGAKPGPVAF